MLFASIIFSFVVVIFVNFPCCSSSRAIVDGLFFPSARRGMRRRRPWQWESGLEPTLEALGKQNKHAHLYLLGYAKAVLDL